MSRVLGVDLGAQRIGIAVSDLSRVLATPLTTIRRSKDPVADRRAILDLAAEYEVDTIVVGLPLTMSGEVGAAAESARAEIAALQDVVSSDVQVLGVDERLTTVSAQRMLAERGVRAKDRRAQVDEQAAAIILQTFLEASP